MAESELQSGAAAPARDIAEARRQIAEAVLRLAAAGAIELGEPAGEAP
jgi:flagellar motor switch protein FliG